MVGAQEDIAHVIRANGEGSREASCGSRVLDSIS